MISALDPKRRPAAVSFSAHATVAEQAERCDTKAELKARVTNALMALETHTYPIEEAASLLMLSVVLILGDTDNVAITKSSSV